ncbi:Major facilitator superfamily transporter [Nitratireductor basaltis]|uniref:Major facilitator superfamily transporter n=2 Tax=Nitratireductor basaltis TaxID=472175 RepID=A0A084U6Z5_9HYPH|nr:MFS transporter [Nitratireductor basaltis]KFB08731.1 Major facilitator superfamily transporter [Nitratireductor basaltis]
MSATDGVIEEKRVSRRGIWGWMLFDWAQQPFHTLIITFVFAPYFASAVAPNAAQGQEMWGLATGVGGLLIALSSPVLGAIADASGPRKPWIAVFAVIGILANTALWFAVPDMQHLWLVMALVSLAVFGMEFAAVFNNAMMPGLVPREELGRLSGSAWGLGYLGGLVSLILVLGFMSASPESGLTILGVEPIFGLDAASREGDRAAGPLTGLWFLVFVIPMFLFTPDQPRREAVAGAVRDGLRQLMNTLKSLPTQRSYFSFLASSMLYRDALNALYAFGGIYAAGVLNWSITQIGLFGILANVTGAAGAWIGGRMDQKFGPKFVVTISILVLSACCLLVISTTRSELLFVSLGSTDSSAPDIAFFIAGGFIGAAGGAIQAASRTLLVDQVPQERVTEAFGLYALSGKATTFIGPFAVAAATAFFSSRLFDLSVEDAQRLGVTPILLLFVLGLVLLPMVQQRVGEG